MSEGLKPGEHYIMFASPNNGIPKTMFWFEQLKQHLDNGGSVIFHDCEHSAKDYIDRLPI